MKEEPEMPTQRIEGTMTVSEASPAEVSALRKKLKAVKKKSARRKATLKEFAHRIEDLSAQLEKTQADHDRLNEEIARLRETAAAQDNEMSRIRASYATLTRDRDTLEEMANARSFHTITALEQKEARQRATAERLQKTLSETKARLGKPDAGPKTKTAK